jgi:uncharacterized protein YbbC (DUF1343 family)
MEVINEEYDDTYEFTLKELIKNLLLFPEMIHNNFIKEKLNEFLELMSLEK